MRARYGAGGLVVGTTDAPTQRAAARQAKYIWRGILAVCVCDDHFVDLGGTAHRGTKRVAVCVHEAHGTHGGPCGAISMAREDGLIWRSIDESSRRTKLIRSQLDNRCGRCCVVEG